MTGQADADLDWLGPARYERWWLAKRRVGSVERAGAFVADVGLALLFPAPGLALPTLWEAVAGDDAEPFATGMGRPEQRVWTWKDQLPLGGSAWYGRFLRGRASLLAPDLLAALYRGAGTPDDHRDLPLSADAHRLADMLAIGPQPSSVLRAELGRSSYARAYGELQRGLLVTSAGVFEGTGWPAAMVELTCRLFDVGDRADRAYATDRFLGSVLMATPADLARAYRWSAAEARSALNALVAAGRARRADGSYVSADV